MNFQPWTEANYGRTSRVSLLPHSQIDKIHTSDKGRGEREDRVRVTPCEYVLSMYLSHHLVAGVIWMVPE